MAAMDGLNWIPDPTMKLVDVDPYSHWMLAYGRDFDFNALEPIEENGDFSYLAIVDEQTFADRIAPAQLLADLVEFDLNGPRMELIESIAGLLDEAEDEENDSRPPAAPRHVFRMPLRRRSVGALSARGDDGGREPVEFGDSEPASPPEIDTNEPLVITAVIDDHINVVHHRFQVGGKSRVDFAWFQDGLQSGTEAVPFGKEVTKTDIDAVLTGPDAPATDDARLRRLGLIDFTRPVHNPLALRASHGTHVLDLAAGAPPDGENLANWRIITVSLPSIVTFDTSGAFLGAFFVMGLQYILKRARELSEALGKPATLIINCSYGIAGGPHDGSHFIERSIEGLLADYESGGGTAALILPAGNGNLDRGHASVVAPGEAGGGDQRQTVTLELPWRLQPGDLTSSYLEIWLPEGTPLDPANLALSIQLPGGLPLQLNPLPSGPAGPNDLRETAVLLCEGVDDNTPENPVARAHLSMAPGGRHRIVLAVAPTKVLAGARRNAPAGLWRVAVSASLRAGERIDAWIQRDASPIGSRVQGRQSYFDDPDYARFDERKRARATDPPGAASIVRRTGTINGVATGSSPIVVAGYAEGDQGAGTTAYSGSGVPGGRTPDIAAVSDRSRVLAGIMAAGTNSGSRVSINGTSAAAPQVARQLAEAGLAGAGSGGDALTSRLPGDVRDFVALPPGDSRASRVGRGWLAPQGPVVWR